MNKNEAEQ